MIQVVCSGQPDQQTWYRPTSNQVQATHSHDSHGEPALPDNDETLAYRMEEYMMSGSFFTQMDNFAKQHAHKFEDVGGGEHPHEWFAIFQEYGEMISDRVETFLLV